MNVSFLKKSCGAKIEGKKSGKLFFFSSISAMSLPQNNLPFFFLLFRHHNFFLEMIRPQHFHNIFTTNFKWQVVTNY